MKAAVYDHPGGPEVFRYQEVPDPQLTADGVLVAVEAISVPQGGPSQAGLGRPRDPGGPGPCVGCLSPGPG